MSRVDRHKDEYSKADRMAVESTGAEGKASESAKQQVVNTPVGGRAARNKAVNQADDLGVWDQTEEEKKRARKEARAMRDGKPEFHGGKAFGKFLSFIGTLIMIVAIVACLCLTLPRFAGIDQYQVASGSMEPALPVGSMIYAAQTEPSTLTPGDIIVFNNDEGNSPVTHRVVENNLAEGSVITKGDANEQNDLNPVLYNDILGKVVLHVPMLGYIAAPFGTLVGKIAMGCVIIAAYLLSLAGRRLSR